MFSLYEALTTRNDAISWCAQHSLIHNRLKCQNCRIFCSLNKKTASTDGIEWKCKICKSRKSIRIDSIFLNSKAWIKRNYFFNVFLIERNSSKGY